MKEAHQKFLRSNFQMKAPQDPGLIKSTYQQSNTEKTPQKPEFGHANTEKAQSHIKFGLRQNRSQSESKAAFVQKDRPRSVSR